MMIKRLSALILLITISITSYAQRNFEFRSVSELGFVGVLSHKIQFSNSGTYFDYVKDGGQDVLFPVSRLSLELDFKNRNTLFFLYQPLRLDSKALLAEDLSVDELTFPANTGVNLRYNFPFYRISYLRELMPKNEKYSFGIGASVQVRNATINFESTDGTLLRTSRDLGVVPIMKARFRAELSDWAYTEVEADGFYAPISYLNGSDNEVIGAILDASLRGGLKINDPIDVFFNLRYLGGGGVGTGDIKPGEPGDGYLKNWLHVLTASAGAVYKW